MAKAHDILLDENGVPVIKDGDYVIAESDGQHIQDIFLSDSGVWRDSPVLGIRIMSYINSPNSLERRNELERAVRSHLEYDGYQVGKIDISDITNPKVDAKRVK